MYELVPPQSKVVKFETPYLEGVAFNLKVFNFDEDEQYNALIFEHSNIGNAEGEEVEIDNENYYLEVFKLGVSDIEGVEGKFTPSWRVIKSVVNKIVAINSVTELEK